MRATPAKLKLLPLMSTITATPGDLNIIAIEKVNLDNIGSL